MRKWFNKKEIRLWELYSKERGVTLLNSLRELDKKQINNKKNGKI